MLNFVYVMLKFGAFIFGRAGFSGCKGSRARLTYQALHKVFFNTNLYN